MARSYWDGSFAGNPAIFPLVYECDAPDILLVHITPAERPGVPKTSPAIMNRMQEISFNVSLIREMRTIAYLNRLVETKTASWRGQTATGPLDRGRGFDQKIFLVEPTEQRLEVSLNHLHALGRTRADEWLAANFDQIGVKSTVDLQAKYF